MTGIGKAWGALGMGISSRTIRDRLKDRPAFQSALAAASHGRFIPVPGGVLALNEAGEVIGAVGISGDASDKDEYAAITGVQRAGLKSHPERPAENWRDAGLYAVLSWRCKRRPCIARAAVANRGTAGYIARFIKFSRAAAAVENGR